MTKKTGTKFETTNLLYNRYKTINNTTIVGHDTTNAAAQLVELYFVGCPPCELKFKAIQKVRNNFDQKKLDIIMICDGSISAYDSFVKHAQKNKTHGIVFLYDNDSTLINSKISTIGYPFEFLFYRNSLIKKRAGFSSYIFDIYVDEEIKEINKLLSNEK